MNNENEVKLGYALNTPLEEAQQIESVEDTDSTGIFNAVLDGNKLAITGNFSSLTSPLSVTGGEDSKGNAPSAIHLHIGDSGENGDIIRNLMVTDNGDNSGSFIGRFELNESEIAAAFDDGLYINLHTEDNPTGELRGQIELDTNADDEASFLSEEDIQEPSMGGIDLRNLAEDLSAKVEFHITREADFDNVIDFYTVDGDGNVVDSVTGEVIAEVGDDNYQEAAIANRLEFNFSVADDSGVTVTKDMPGGYNYAPMVVVQGTFGEFTNNDASDDPQVYFAYKEANADGVERIRNTPTDTGTSFGFEDLPDGGDLDYNDITFEISIVDIV